MQAAHVNDTDQEKSLPQNNELFPDQGSTADSSDSGSVMQDNPYTDNGNNKNSYNEYVK